MYSVPLDDLKLPLGMVGMGPGPGAFSPYRGFVVSLPGPVQPRWEVQRIQGASLGRGMAAKYVGRSGIVDRVAEVLQSALAE